MSQNKSDARARHWQKTRNTSFIVLAFWFFFAFVIHWFAFDLNEMLFMGFPLGYYMAAQGSLFVFVVLLFVHNWLQDKIDNESGLDQ